MTVKLAKIAGVNEIVACSPASKDGSLNPHIIYALHKSGATEIFESWWSSFYCSYGLWN